MSFPRPTVAIFPKRHRKNKPREFRPRKGKCRRCEREIHWTFAEHSAQNTLCERCFKRHYEDAWQNTVHYRGCAVCVDEVPMEGSTICRACSDKKKAQNAQIRARYAEEGRCSCGRPRTEGFKTCQTCRDRAKAARARAKAGQGPARRVTKGEMALVKDYEYKKVRDAYLAADAAEREKIRFGGIAYVISKEVMSR